MIRNASALQAGAACLAMLLPLGGCGTDGARLPSAVEAAQSEEWQLMWADEFDGAAVDKDRWTVVEDCWGGGNEERQCYTARPQNVAVNDGMLIITAREEAFTGPAWPASFGPADADPAETATKPFTSAKLTTQSHSAWTYGRFEMRARLPQGQGVWPAFWMLPEGSAYGSWAASGEIDILEAVNLGVECEKCETGGENSLLDTLHFGGQWPDNDFFGTEVSMPAILDNGFHTYGVNWEEGRFTWTFDGEPYATAQASDWFTTATSNPDAPFDKPFHLIINLAVGGGLPESRGLGGVSAADFPKRMEVDWVRVWQCGADASSTRACTGN
ncbi:glycoside hydrolase family 16 protein [Aurantiacibacter rhizosphaerae]|uniref:Family 16 glycosylhydrolase n=1 Tax=Aurantiacibacter rhizosphaerae TaxID=2691582 RepID=A0A844XHJ2_9SPHN|nr:glycoside hydrolase family 16 protein [Aurantiacibacter rhizosphaerae]MWV29034.1 family 16 glycosylhydrolase [Aurantiacibacter rhizosphaerae]